MEYTPEQQVSFETMVADRYEVDPEYFAEKYGMPVGPRLHAMSPMAELDPTGEEEKPENEKKQNARTQRPFFD